MAILLNNHGHDNAEWRAAFADLLPELEVQDFPCADAEKVRYAVIWNHPAGDLQNYPNLKAILNLGAGTDYLEQDQNLPRIPIVRLVDPQVGINMAQYVAYWVMHFQRGYEHYRQHQAERTWARMQTPFASDYRVCVFGLGMIGEFIARYIAQLGFDTYGWNRSNRSIAKVQTFTGSEQLDDALAVSDVLVNCLPYNTSTQNLIGERELGLLPEGANIITVGRGGVVNDEALIAALDRGHINIAALDCFVEEPLVADSPLWTHPKIFVTPHMSGATYARAAAEVIAENIKRLERGEKPYPIYEQFPYD